jgi:hypothetical protein
VIQFIVGGADFDSSLAPAVCAKMVLSIWWCLLGCCVYRLVGSSPTFQSCVLTPVSGRWGSKLLWNVGLLPPDCTAQHCRRQSSSYSSPWEPEI